MKVKVSGSIKLTLLKNGKKIEERKVKNLVVNSGLNHIADQLSDSPDESAMSYMAIGTGTTAPTSSDTALESEVARVALTSKTDSGSELTYVGEFGEGVGTGAITEAGIFNASSGGTMLARQVFSAINKGASDTLRIEWTISFSAS